MNRGDAGYIQLNIRINNAPIEEGYADDIEITFATEGTPLIKTLKKGEITWYETEPGKGLYRVFLNQKDTLSMREGNNAWQIRVLKDASVVSSRPGAFVLGGNISTNILG